MSDEIPETEIKRWQWEQNRQIADRYYDHDRQFTEKINIAAIDNANIALRTLILINGGAAVAVLAFLGGIISADTNELLDDITQLTAPIVWFAWGVALATLAMGFAYVTNYFIAGSVIKRKYKYVHPYVEETESSKRWSKWATKFQIVAIILALLSLVCFLIGMYSVRNAAKFSTETSAVSE